MDVQDLVVLIALADRARNAGLIKFEEFARVAKAVENASAVVKQVQDQEQAAKEAEVTTEEVAAPKKKTVTKKISE